jgi:hypothetical protein
MRATAATGRRVMPTSRQTPCSPPSPAKGRASPSPAAASSSAAVLPPAAATATATAPLLGKQPPPPRHAADVSLPCFPCTRFVLTSHPFVGFLLLLQGAHHWARGCTWLCLLACGRGERLAGGGWLLDCCTGGNGASWPNKCTCTLRPSIPPSAAACQRPGPPVPAAL